MPPQTTSRTTISNQSLTIDLSHSAKQTRVIKGFQVGLVGKQEIEIIVYSA